MSDPASEREAEAELWELLEYMLERVQQKIEAGDTAGALEDLLLAQEHREYMRRAYENAPRVPMPSPN